MEILLLHIAYETLDLHLIGLVDVTYPTLNQSLWLGG